MSEQIQDVLNEMENKFQESFSKQIGTQQIINSQNPQSAKKLDQKVQNQFILKDFDLGDLNEMKNQLQEELLKKQNENGDSNSRENQNEKSEVKRNKKSQEKHSTPNFKFKNKKNVAEDQCSFDLRKVQSYNQHSFQPLNDDQTGGNNSELNPYYYQQLTMKLEKALNKISSHNHLPRNKHTQSGNLTFYQRLNQFQQKKQRQIERKKAQIQQKQIKDLQQRPLINSHSKKIINQLRNQPIFIRCDKILQQKKKKQQDYKRIKQQKQQKQYEQYKKQHESHMQKIKQKYNEKSIRSSDEYYHQMDMWLKNKEKNIQAKKNQQQQKLKNQNTFKPLINSKSQKILLLSNKKKQQKRVPIFDREPKIKEQVKDANCTFKPKINKNNFYKKMTFYQAQV